MASLKCDASYLVGGVYVRALDALKSPELDILSAPLQPESSFGSMKVLDVDARFCYMDSASAGEPTLTNHLESVIDRMVGKDWFWLDCTNVNENELEMVTNAIGGAHPLTMDILKSRSASRDALHEVNNYRLVTFSGAKSIGTEVPVGFKMLMASNMNGVITLHEDSSEAYAERSSAVRSIVRLLNRGTCIDQEWIAYTMLQNVATPYAGVVQHVLKDANWVSDKVYIDYQSVEAEEILGMLAQTRTKCVSVAQLLRGKPDIIQAIARRCGNREVALYLHDLQDHLATMRARLEANEAQLGNTHRNWMAVTQMNNERSKSRILGVIGQFVAFATVLMPAISVYTAAHMNLEYPGAGHEGSNLTRWGIFLLVVLGLVVTVLVSAALYMSRILKRPPPPLY